MVLVKPGDAEMRRRRSENGYPELLFWQSVPQSDSSSSRVHACYNIYVLKTSCRVPVGLYLMVNMHTSRWIKLLNEGKLGAQIDRCTDPLDSSVRI